jgi:hypothetical protein
MGFYAPCWAWPAFIASTVQPIPLIRSLPVSGECASTASVLPSTVVSGPKESKLLNRIQKIMNNLPASVLIASSQDRLVVFHHDPRLLAGTNKWAANQNG